MKILFRFISNSMLAFMLTNHSDSCDTNAGPIKQYHLVSTFDLAESAARRKWDWRTQTWQDRNFNTKFLAFSAETQEDIHIKEELGNN